jgi:DNA-binding response OmpR family regulator
MASPPARHVLIIDDEPDVGFYLTTVLKQHGFQVEVAASTDAAWAELNRQTPALVCLDIMMPRESGISLYTRMKGSDRFKSLPVLIVSGVAPASDFDFRKFVPDVTIPPPDGYVEKPIQIESFVAKVEELAFGSQKRRARKKDAHA